MERSVLKGDDTNRGLLAFARETQVREREREKDRERERESVCVSAQAKKKKKKKHKATDKSVILKTHQQFSVRCTHTSVFEDGYAFGPYVEMSRNRETSLGVAAKGNRIV